MPSNLINHITETNINFYEYNVSFSNPLFPSDVIYIGLDYSNNNILAEFNGEQIIVASFDDVLAINDYYRLCIILDVDGINNTVIPYTFYFDFSSDGSLTNESRNGFLQVLPRPTININLSDDNIYDDESTTLTYTSDGSYVNIELLKNGSILTQYDDNLPPSGFITYTNPLPANYVIRATTYNEPLIYDAKTVDLTVIAGDKNVFIQTIINTNNITGFEVVRDTLPIIITAVVDILAKDKVSLCFTTENATRVDVLTTFSQDFLNLSPNECVIFLDLKQNTTYELTIVASDDDGDIDTRQVSFEIVGDVIVDNNLIGVDNKMTFSVSAGVYTKEQDLSFIAEQFTGTHGSYAGKFKWGPCLERVRVSKEEDLVTVFQKPSTNVDNAIDFLVAAAFLNYSNVLDVVRLASYNGSTYLNKNSIVKPYFNTLKDYGTAEPTITVLNDEQYTNMLDGDLENNTFFGRFTGDLGNSLGISFAVSDSNSDFSRLSNGYSYNFTSTADVDLDISRNNFYFSRDKYVRFNRESVVGTVRSILDIGDWLNLEGVRYQIRNITLGTDNQVTGIAIDDGGTGYTTTPTLAISGTGTGATATATLATTGSVKTINVTTGGTGYTTATVAITGNGTGATATATISGGSVTAITVTSGGTGYSGTVTATVTGDGTGAVLSVVLGYAIASATVVTKGSGYSGSVTVTVTGNGTGADLVAVVNSIDQIELDRIYRGNISTGSYDLSTVVTGFDVLKQWRFSDVVGIEPNESSIHIVVFDAVGKFSGVNGAILERYSNLSLDEDVKNEDGTSNYFATRINASSYYIRIGTKNINDISQFLINTDTNALNKDWITNYIRLASGDDSFETMGLDDDIAAYDLYKDPEQCDAPIIIGNFRSIKNDGGIPNGVLGSYLIQNIAENRKDSMVYLSCRRESVVNNPRNEVREILRDVLSLPSSSYGEMDSGWKYTYDRYNDRYIWIPTSGDHAGCYSRTDKTNEAWFSAAGQRGTIRNIVKLAFNPNETQRDQLYANRINPIVTFGTDGTQIYGDKTLLNLSSGFNRIPTRRLFIVLEKTISKASRFALFEFNDSQTQAQLRSVIEGFLGEVKSKRGCLDYRVIIDESNNTPQVVSSNQLKGRILVKPNYSINFIELTFSNLNSIITFEEATATA